MRDVPTNGDDELQKLKHLPPLIRFILLVRDDPKLPGNSGEMPIFLLEWLAV